jgi:sugar phosphate isomerase/epimerase
MRIGFTNDAEVELLDWAAQNGFGSFAWMRFDRSAAAPGQPRWQEAAQEFAAAAASRNIRISAIGAYYRNALNPAQTETARALVLRAIEVAALIGVKTVSAFPGGVIVSTVNPRGGQPTIEPLENFIPQMVSFWEPIAKFAADRGIRIAFEHCPQGIFRQPVMNYNLFGQPANWERFFNATACENIGLEWDAAHLVCQFIDPVANLRKFGKKAFHVHAKDGAINRELLARYGICHPGVMQHRLPGFGESDWGQIIAELRRAGYDSDVNIEGYHDPIYRDHPADADSPLAGQKLEREGWLRAKRYLESCLCESEPQPAQAAPSRDCLSPQSGE